MEKKIKTKVAGGAIVFVSCRYLLPSYCPRPSCRCRVFMEHWKESGKTSLAVTRNKRRREDSRRRGFPVRASRTKKTKATYSRFVNKRNVGDISHGKFDRGWRATTPAPDPDISRGFPGCRGLGGAIIDLILRSEIGFNDADLWWRWPEQKKKKGTSLQRQRQESFK